MTGALATLDQAGLAGLPAPAGAGMGAGMIENRPALTQRQKAAIIVRLLLSEGVPLSLKELPEQLQAELTHEMANMRFVDRATLRAVIEEFVTEIEDIGLSFPGGIDKALGVLDGTISPATAAKIRKSTGAKLTGDPWEAIAGLPPERLMPVIEAESTEIAAVLLSKIKVSTAAELLGRLPGARARAITYAVSLTSAIKPDVVDRIGAALIEQLEAQPAQAFDHGPVERVGAILNRSPAATRDEVLVGLDEDDASFASEVRKAIFTFANIPGRVDPRDMPKITREVDQAQLVTALAAARAEMADVAEFVLGSMSKRMAEQIREEMDELGKVKPADGEAAMNAVVAAIRELESQGELFLIAEDEDE